MTAEEKLLISQPAVTSVMDVPPAPFCIQGEKSNLYGAGIEVHLINDDIDYGKLHSISNETKELNYVSSKNYREILIKFSEIRFVLFTAELQYQLNEHPLQEKSNALAKPELPQPFDISFSDSRKLSGDSAISVIGETSLHVFKVKLGNVANRMFIPLTSVQTYSIGEQIGTILQASNEVSETDLEKGLQKQQEDRGRPLGEYLKEQGVVSDADLQRTLKQQKDWPKLRLGELLIEEGLITELQLNEALDLQKEDRSRRLGDILIDIGATTEDGVHSAMAHKLGIPFVHLKEFDIDPSVLDMIPADLARKHSAMPLMLVDQYLVIAVPDPTQADKGNELSFVANRSIELSVATPGDISWAIDHYYGDEIHDGEDMLDAQVLPEQDDDQINEDMEKLANERPIVRLVQNLISESVERGASDIHIRPLSKSVQVLFRIHGKLTHVRNFGKSLLPPIVSRIKVISHMDVAQRRLPQDGRVQMMIKDEVKDMRVSTIPTVEGESVVIRLLASAATLKPLDELGFTNDDTEVMGELLQRGSGMLLVTGPTGSGKSTTLYSALNVLREMNVNIITAEDPVEIRLDGLEQVQVQKEIGMDFGRVLRNILRHDPDVIMVGEIRDEETAKIAVQAAQTGHLVLSTLAYQ